jgi:hypothetical protein
MPVAWASSTYSRAPWRSAICTSPARSARSPSMLNTDSVAISLRPWCCGQQGVEVVKIVVAKHRDRAARGARAVDHAGVIELITENRVRISSADSWSQVRQRRQHRGIGLEAAGEQQRRLAALEGGEPLFNCKRDLARAGDQARRGGPGTVALRPFGGALLEQRVLRQAEVIVGRGIDQDLPAAVMQTAVGTGQRAQPAALRRAGIQCRQLGAQQRVQRRVHQRPPRAR